MGIHGRASCKTKTLKQKNPVKFTKQKRQDKKVGKATKDLVRKGLLDNPDPQTVKIIIRANAVTRSKRPISNKKLRKLEKAQRYAEKESNKMQIEMPSTSTTNTQIDVQMMQV